MGSTVMMFADDNALISSGNTPEESASKVETDLNTLHEYFAKLKLNLNITKTKVMHFHKNIRKYNPKYFPTITMNGTYVESVSEFKYLGVLIESSLKFSSQMDANLKKANYKMYLFRKIRPCIDNSTAVTLFKTMLLPYVEFANVFLLGCDEIYLIMRRV